MRLYNVVPDGCRFGSSAVQLPTIGRSNSDIVSPEASERSYVPLEEL